MREPGFVPLKPKQRKFIELIVYQGFTREEAFSQVMNETLTEENKSSILSRANNVFNLPQVRAYYDAIMGPVREKSVNKAAWTKDIAETKLIKLIEYAENELYGTGGSAPQRVTMGRLNAILLPAKELNTMNGLNTTSNVNLSGEVVQIVGEDSLED